MRIILALFVALTALTAAFCAGRASGIGRQVDKERAAVARRSNRTQNDPEELRRVAAAMSEVGEGPLAQEYRRWVKYSYAWSAGAVVIFILLLVLT
jgi:hypothetical protein